MKPTLFGQHTASVFISLVQGHTRAWINSSQSASAVTQPDRTRFLCHTNKCEDWMLCHTVLRGSDVTSNRCRESIWRWERRGGGGRRGPLKTLTHHKTWRGGGEDEFWGEEGEIGSISQFFHSGPDWLSERKTSVDVTLGHGDTGADRAERKMTQLSGFNICTQKGPSPTIKHVCTVASTHSSVRSDSVTWVRNRQRWDNKKRPGVGGVGNSDAERLPCWKWLLFSTAEKSSSHSRPAGQKKTTEHTVTHWWCVNSPQLHWKS